MLENNTKKDKKNSENYKSTKRTYNHIDDVINDAYLLSDLRKPLLNKTRTDKDGQATKKSKIKNLSPILFVSIKRTTGKKKRQTKTKLVKALVDTGASESIISLESAKGLPLKTTTEPKKWSTAAGLLQTSSKTKQIEFGLPELHNNRKIKKSFHVVDVDLKNYDMIIGRDLIASLQLDIRGSDLSIKWDDAAIPWRGTDSTVEDIYLTDDRQSYQPVEQEMQRMTDILDAKYKKANLEEISNSADHLTNSEQKSLLQLF